MSGSFGPGRESSSYGGSKDYGGGQHNNAGSRSGGGNQGSGSFQGGGLNPMTRDKMMAQDKMGAMVSKAMDDFKGRDDSFLDKIGNALAGTFGFNEMDPSLPGFSKMGPKSPSVTGKANWGFDPAVALGGALGMGFGIPGTGMIANQLSQWAGRPLEMNMGPEVFGSGGPSMPQGVQTAAGGPGGGGVPPQGGGTGNGGQRPGHTTGNPNLPVPKPGSPMASGLVPMPGKPPAAPISAIPYANAIPMPGQVKLPANYFMSQVA